MINPWRRLRELTTWRLDWHHHDDSPELGWTDFAAEIISLRSDLNQAQRRSTIMHEVLHAERGPVPMGLADREELRVCRIAAQELLPDVRLIGDALAWAQGDLVTAAEELWVDEETLRVRLRYMTHPAERAHLAQRLEEDHR